MSEANKKQIGGDHYKTGGMEHWDVMILFGIHYLYAAASKYVQRHRSKAGRVDLEKAVHYLEKALENRIFTNLPNKDMDVVYLWAKNTVGMTMQDYEAIRFMFSGGTRNAIDMINSIMDRDYPIDDKPTIGRAVGRSFTKDPALIGDRNDYLFIRGTRMINDGRENWEKDILDVNRQHPHPLPKNEIDKLVADLKKTERRVPRFDTETEMRHRVGEIEQTTITRGVSPNDRTEEWDMRPRGDTPWIVTDSWMQDYKARRDVVPVTVLESFYVKWAPDCYKLEAFVESPIIPAELQTCYAILTNHNGPTSWLLDVRRVPAHLRDYFPRLPRELNYVQLEQSPSWWKALYKEEETKWVITNEAWCGEA